MAHQTESIKMIVDLVSKLAALQTSLDPLVRAVEDEPTSTRRTS